MHRPKPPPRPPIPDAFRRVADELRRRPIRAPRVTDDDDDGLAGAPVPRRPKPVSLSGGAAQPLPEPSRVD
jgi:hypothetical protein